jgi:hypothetical protein
MTMAGQQLLSSTHNKSRKNRFTSQHLHCEKDSLDLELLGVQLFLACNFTTLSLEKCLRATDCKFYVLFYAGALMGIFHSYYIIFQPWVA